MAMATPNKQALGCRSPKVLLLNQARMACRPLVPGFLKLLWFVHQYVCICVCVSVCSPRGALITSGVIWCDIGRVRLVKQVLRLSPAFNYFM